VNDVLQNALDLWLTLTLAVRLVLVAIAGFTLGSLCNWATYRLAWNQRSISPWSEPDPSAPTRRWSDRIPIVGWPALARESQLHGRLFWLRPMAVEIGCGVALAALYWWECDRLGLYPRRVISVPESILHLQFLSHAVLLALMVAASLIDIDERLIPDGITFPGTVLGLLLAAVAPWSLLPDVFQAGLPQPLSLEVTADMPPDGFALFQQPLHLAAPKKWPSALDGLPHTTPLWIALACYGLWWFALLERPWYGRHGLGRAWRVCWAHMCRQLGRQPRWQGGRLAIGIGLIVFAWWWSGPAWAGLLTALVGLVGGGLTVWSVRIIGHLTLGREAMGFGDVILLMMIGTFVGWQTCLLIFFIAPMAGLLVGVMQLALRRDQYIPYGPFLCLATLASIVYWRPIWNWARPLFDASQLILAVLAACLVFMALGLFLWRLVKQAFFVREA